MFSYSQDFNDEKETKKQKAEKLTLAFENFLIHVQRITSSFATESVINDYQMELNKINNLIVQYNDKWMFENIYPLLNLLIEKTPSLKQSLDRYWKADINEIIRRINNLIDQHIEFLEKPKKPVDDNAIKQLNILLAKLSHVLDTIKQNPNNLKSAWFNFINGVNDSKSPFLKQKFTSLSPQILDLIYTYEKTFDNNGKTAVLQKLTKTLTPHSFALRSYIDKLKSKKTTIAFYYQKFNK